MKVLIIGAGNMGLTYGQSFIDASILHPNDLYFLERHAHKADIVSQWSSNPLQTLAGPFLMEMDLIILGVKPQDFPELAESLKPHLAEHHLVLSIMAGITLETLQQSLEIDKLVRAMPNLPAQVGQGMTVFSTSSNVSKLEIFTIQNLLNTTGKTLYVEDEALIDSATAVSGSGPAFVFYFMNAMMASARQMGFSDSEAQLLVRQTFLGSVNLLNRNSLHCEEWIARVSSKGGTTEAAMGFFSQKDLQELIHGGMETARQRAVSLRTGKAEND